MTTDWKPYMQAILTREQQINWGGASLGNLKPIPAGECCSVIRVDPESKIVAVSFDYGNRVIPRDIWVSPSNLAELP
jgi:hypothetical protein